MKKRETLFWGVVSVFLMSAFWLVFSSSAYAATVYVDVNACPGGGSGTEDNPYCSLEWVVTDSALAADGDTVIVKEGVYDPSTQVFPISINRPLTIKGEGADKTTIDAQYGATNDNIFSVGSAGVTFEDLAINGYNTDDGMAGRAIHVDASGGGTIEISNCIIDGESEGDYVIGMEGQDFNLNIHHTTFRDNEAEIMTYSASSGKVTGTFNNNAVVNSGLGPTVSIPAADNYEVELDVFNNIFYESGTGLLLFNESAVGGSVQADVYNNTFVGGTVGVSVRTGAEATIKNNIFSNVQAGVFIDGGGSVTGDYNGFNETLVNYYGASDGANDLTKDPQFVNFQSGMSGAPDFHLSSNSPFIDAGTADGAPLFDYDDTIRPYDAGFDIGAYETDTTIPSITNQFPTNGDTNIDPEEVIIFNVADSDSGIDIESLNYTINGSVSGDINVEVETRAATAGSDRSYSVSLIPLDPFNYNETINVSVSISDNNIPSNTAESSWSFVTERGSRGMTPTNGMIVTSSATLGGPHYNIFKADGTLLSTFFGYNESLRGEFKSTVANVDGTGGDEIVLSAGAGLGPHLRIFTQQGEELASLMAYDSNFRGGLNVISADFTGDGNEEIAVVPTSQGGPNVRVLRYTSEGFGLVDQFMAYSSVFHGGVNLAAGDIDGDGAYELIAAPLTGGGPNMQVYRYTSDGFELVDQEMVYDESFRGGVNVASGDLDGDGKEEIIVAPRSNGGPQVRVYQVKNSQLELAEGFMVYDEAYRGGLELETADFNYDGKAEIVVAPAGDANPNVRIYQYGSGKYSNLLGWFMAGGSMSKFKQGLRISASDMNEDGRAELVIAPKENSPRVRIYNLRGTEMKILDWFWAYDESYEGDINISVGRR